MAVIAGDVVSGGRSLEVGGPATKKKLKRGDTMILDLQATYNNYWSDTARTFVIGAPSEKQRQVHETLVAAKTAAAKMPQARVRPRRAWRAPSTGSSRRAGTPEDVPPRRSRSRTRRPGEALVDPGSNDKVEEDQAYAIEPGHTTRRSVGYGWKTVTLSQRTGWRGSRTSAWTSDILLRGKHSGRLAPSRHRP